MRPPTTPAGRCRADQAATSLYALADTANPPKPLTTALPNDFYPESTWHDDMELGACRDRAGAEKPGPRRRRPTSPSPRTGRRTTSPRTTGDTFNLYDTSALAHADLVAAISGDGTPAGLAVTTNGPGGRPQAAGRLGGVTRRAPTSFHAGGDYDDFDVDAHTFGLIATEALYRRLSGDTSLRRLRHRAARLGARRQRLGHQLHGRRGQHASRTACSTRWPTSTGSTNGRAAGDRRGGQRPQRLRPVRRRPRRLPGRHGPLLRRRRPRTPPSTATAAVTSTTCGPGRPTSRPST